MRAHILFFCYKKNAVAVQTIFNFYFSIMFFNILYSLYIFIYVFLLCYIIMYLVALHNSLQHQLGVLYPQTARIHHL